MESRLHKDAIASPFRRTTVGLILVLVLLESTACALRSSQRPASGHGPWLGRSSGKSGPTNWFMNQRRNVDGTIPLRARARALERQSVMEGASLAPGTWVPVGPTNVGGRVTALAVDPTNASHLWLGTAAGGVFTSTNAGTAWTPVFDAQSALSIGSLAAHPTDANTLYVGTGEDNGGGFSYDGEGVFKTTNGGASFTPMGLAETRRIGRIAVDPVDPQRVFVAGGGDWFTLDGHRGIYRTTDGGSSWQQVLYVADDTGGIDVAIDPLNHDRILAALWQRYSFGSHWYVGGTSGGIYRSIDGGDTWTKITAGLPPSPGRIGLAFAPSSPTTVYAFVADDQGALDGIYRSLDSGVTWTKRNGAGVPAQFSGYSYYFGQLRVHPTNPDTIYVFDVPLFVSTNGGQTFSTIANAVHVDWHALVVEPTGRWLAGTDGGFYRSLDSGANWQKATNLPITQLYDLGFSATNPLLRFVGCQDNGTVRTTTGGTSNWGSVLGGDGLQCEVDPTDASKVYAEFQFGEIRRSTNGGASFQIGTSGIDSTDRTNWNSPITIDPALPTTLYTGTFRVYRSTNSAVSWSAISADLSNGHPEEGETDPDKSHLMNLVDGTITVVAVSPLDPNVLWAGTDDGNVWVSANGGTLWTQVNPPGPAYWVTDVEPSPFDAATAYMTVTGYRTGDDLPYVRVTRDLGATWDDLSAGLPQVPVSTVLPSVHWPGRLFVGNDLGVYLSDDDGASWTDMRTGMPYVVVMDLEEPGAAGTLYAASHARSVYGFDLSQLPPADGDGDGVTNDQDCALADPGSYAPPTEAGPLEIGRGLDPPESFLAWPSQAAQAGSGTTYDIATGAIADLPVSGTPGATALLCGYGGTSWADTSDPAEGQGVYFLVRARNGCGTGTWGNDSAGTPRTVVACP